MRRARPLPAMPGRSRYRYTMLTLDPSFTATGWAVIDLGRAIPIGGGVIRTAKAKRSERLTAAEDDAQRGLSIFKTITAVIQQYDPLVIAQEGNLGSQSAVGAKGLARAQQACVDAICALRDGSLPLFVTPQYVQKTCTGKRSASKPEMEAAAVARWPGVDLAAFVAAVPKGQRDGFYDALCVAQSVWDHPAVASVRLMAEGHA
jgi:Holliday junction resolvasome RuvABC endonuclease subunit